MMDDAWMWGIGGVVITVAIAGVLFNWLLWRESTKNEWWYDENDRDDWPPSGAT